MSTILSVYTNTGEENMSMQRKKRAHTGKIATVALAVTIIGVGGEAALGPQASGPEGKAEGTGFFSLVGSSVESGSSIGNYSASNLDSTGRLPIDRFNLSAHDGAKPGEVGSFKYEKPTQLEQTKPFGGQGRILPTRKPERRPVGGLYWRSSADL